MRTAILSIMLLLLAGCFTQVETTTQVEPPVEEESDDATSYEEILKNTPEFEELIRDEEYEVIEAEMEFTEELVSAYSQLGCNLDVGPHTSVVLSADCGAVAALFSEKSLKCIVQSVGPTHFMPPICRMDKGHSCSISSIGEENLTVLLSNNQDGPIESVSVTATGCSQTYTNTDPSSMMIPFEVSFEGCSFPKDACTQRSDIDLEIEGELADGTPFNFKGNIRGPKVEGVDPNPRWRAIE